jgi:hypothetical protein
MRGEEMSFLNALRLWHDFYIGMGVASAALLGFVYLGLTQRNGHLNGHGESAALEGQTLGALLGLLIVSLLVLIPDQTPRSLGFTLLAAGLLGVVFTARFLWSETRGRLKGATLAFIAWRAVLPFMVLLAAIAASIVMVVGARNSGMDSLYLMSAAFLALLLITARNTWELLGHFTHERLKLHRGSRS